MLHPGVAARPDVSIVTSGHDVADARLHRIAAAIQRAGGTVEILGLGEPAAAPAGSATRTWPRPGMWGRALLAVRLAALARGNVLLAPDAGSLVAARLVAAARRRPVVADVHEDYRRLLRDRPWASGLLGRLAGVLVAVADRAAAGARVTLVADDHVPPLRARRRLVVRNEADPGLFGSPAEPDPSPRAVYVGDVRRSRGLFTMLDALESAPMWSLDVIGPVAPADREALDARLTAAPALAERVRFHGRLAPARSWDVARGAWVGLALLDDTPAFRDAVPSKLYEYVAAGLVPVVTDLPRQRSLAESAGGVVVRDTAEAGVALRSLADPAELRRHRDRVLEHAIGAQAGPTAYDEAARLILEVSRG